MATQAEVLQELKLLRETLYDIQCDVQEINQFVAQFKASVSSAAAQGGMGGMLAKSLMPQVQR